MISSARSNALALVLALAGCASAPLQPRPPEPVELAAVPFFPQKDYQCGPAALATVLTHAGAVVTPEELVDQVYVAGLRGSLQAELLGATRRHGLVPFVIPPDTNALLTELAAGSPVLVLQNLGFDRFPVWHYAVVVGSDGQHVILRSGTEQRRVQTLRRFLRTWQRGSNWAFVVTEPGRLPPSATGATYVRALAAAEPMLAATTVARGYEAALGRWPEDELVLFGAANARYAAGDLREATVLYRRLLAAAPAQAVARNNLANVLAEQGCPAAALREAYTALAATTVGDDWYQAIRDTVSTLEAQAALGAAEAASCQ